MQIPNQIRMKGLGNAQLFFDSHSLIPLGLKTALLFSLFIRAKILIIFYEVYNTFKPKIAFNPLLQLFFFQLVTIFI